MEGNIVNYITQIRGVSYKPSDLHDSLNKNSIILLRANNINNGKINFEDVVYVDKSKVSETQVLRKNDILICASSGSKKLVGKAASFNESIECTFGAFCKVIRPRNILGSYLSAFFQSEYYRFHISQLANGANINNIKNEHINSFSIPERSFEEQKEISYKVSSLNGIIESYNRELDLLDELIKARFVEMFGDPMINPYKWKVINISEVLRAKASNGFFSRRDDYCDDGNVKVLGVANVVNRMYSQVVDLPRTNANERDIEKFEVKYGDMLFCRSSLVAEGIGKASIIPEGVQTNILFECHVIRLPLDLDKCVPEFLQTLSTTKFFRNQIISKSKTATMTTIGQDGILKTNIILPPLEKQKEYYNFVKQIDKSRSRIQKSLEASQELFDSLMQEYFG